MNYNAWKMPKVTDSDINNLLSLGYGLPNGFLRYLELERQFDFSPILYNPKLPMSMIERTISDIRLSSDSDIVLLVFGDERPALRYCYGWFMTEDNKYRTFKEAIIELLTSAMLEINNPQYYIDQLEWTKGIEYLYTYLEYIENNL